MSIEDPQFWGTTYNVPQKIVKILAVVSTIIGLLILLFAVTGRSFVAALVGFSCIGLGSLFDITQRIL